MTTTSKVLAVIPARGGSKGIPEKNLVRIAGKPLIGFTIEQALATPRVTRAVVSTDSDRIASVAKQFGAEVISRPADISDDSASSESALIHCLDYLRANERYEPDLVVFLQATSPLRSRTDIQQAIDTLESDNADSLFSACRLHSFVWRVGADGPTPLNYDPQRRPRRQDAPDDVAENGSIYVFKPWVLRKLGCRLGGVIAVYRMATLDSLQVDEPDDLPLIEYLLRTRHSDQIRNRYGV